MTNPKGTTVSNDLNLVTSNEKGRKKANAALLEQAKSELLGTLNTLDFEKTLVNRCILANNIADNRFNKGYETGRGIPQGTINLREEEPKMPVNLDDLLNNEYSDLKKDYEKLLNNKPSGYELELKKLDTKLAERIILDNGGSIEFKDGDKYLDNKSAKEESMGSFEKLNKLDQYTGKIELISRKLGKDNYYVIKRTDAQLRFINQRFESLVEEDKIRKENERLRKENETRVKTKETKERDDELEELRRQNEELRRQNEKLSAKNKEEKSGEDNKTEKDGAEDNGDKRSKDYEELKQKYDELLEKIRKDEEEKKKKEFDELKRQNEELKRQNEELLARNNKSDESNDEPETKENKPEKDNNDLNVIVEEQKARIVYLESLLKLNDNDSSEEDDNEEESNDEAVEELEENLLYVSRKSVEKSVLKIRKTSGYPSGIIEIRGEKINVEEFEFYEELKLEYIEAKGDERRLRDLDKEFAELVILFSPIGSEEKDRYTIKLTDKELKRGLYVSSERLERYGLVINFHDYYEKIVEREYKEKVKIVKKIETEIKELSTTIIELTRKINIEKTSTEEILLEIKLKKERIIILKDKLQKLLLSLKAGNKPNDTELLSLKERQKELEDELDKLRKQKKHQDDVNKEIKSLEKEISKLEKKPNNDKVNEDIRKKENELKELKDYIGSLKGDREALLGRLNSDKVTDLEKLNLKERLDKLDKKIKQYEDDAKKLADEIKKLKDQTNNGNEKILEEIKKLKEEEQKTQELVGELEGQERETGETPIGLTGLRDKLERIQKEIKEKEKLLEGEDENLKALKDRLNKLKEEQKGFDKDIDQKIAKKEKELDEIKNKIREKEENTRRRIVVETFDDGDFGAGFAKYCEENGIKRTDGKEIPWRGGLDPSATYVDKDGRELKLEPKTGANDDGYDNPVTYYELVYYEETGNGELSEVEVQLEAIIHEQELLLIELTELEEKLKIVKTKREKIEIEERIKIINEKLTVITERITEFTTIIREFKQTITVRRYRLYSVTAFGHTGPVPTKGLELNSVISDMGTDVFKEKAALKVEEQLKQDYKSLPKLAIVRRFRLFVGRGQRRRNMMRTEMSSMANTAFQTDPNYAALNEQSQNAADRHGHELLTGMAAVNLIGHVHNQQIDQLCKAYLNGGVSDAQFQQNFNTIVANDAYIQSVLRGNNITHIGTNVLLQLKEQRALNVLINTLDGQLNQYIATGNTVYMNNMQTYVEQYIKDYQKLPAFKAVFEQFINGDLNARNQLRRYLSHQKAIMKMQITNLTMNIDIINKGKSAYQIDNKDREKGWKYKLGHFLDKHPWGTIIGSGFLALGLGAATLGTSAVVGAAVSTGVFGSYVGFTNYIKKWTHHTKEQNTHEKNVVTDYRNEQARIQNWQNDALNGRGWRKYKAKRQLALYDETTQANIQLSNQITEYITNLSAKTGTLTANEDNFMKLNLIEGWARLQYYRQMGHNFLASETVDQTEKDMKRLEKAITLGLQKIGRTTNDIQTTMTATNSLGTNITYAVIQNDLKASYDKSLIQFKRERKNLALKYGIGTAVASIGASLAFQYAFGSGVFGKDTPTFSNTFNTSDNFNLGRANGLYNNISSDTDTFLSSVPDGSNITIHYGAGTDATPVIPGRLVPSDLSSKISSVNSYISGLPTKTAGAAGPGLTAADKANFLAEVSGLSGGSGTNGILQNMRHADALKQIAEGLSNSGTSGLNNISLTLDPAQNVIGLTPHTPADRVANVLFEASKEGVPGKKCRFFGVPLFFNTFKDRKASKDTTDQKFGK